jgi:tetratricopeptide (TPR) repeat protein
MERELLPSGHRHVAEQPSHKLPSAVLPARADSGMESTTSSASARNIVLKGASSFAGLAEVVRALHRVKSQYELDSAALRLLDLARMARVVRQPEICRSASNTVLSLPVSYALHTAAGYYETISGSKSDIVCLRTALGRAADGAPPEFRARIVFQIGYGYEAEGNIEEAARYYVETARAARGVDALSRVHALCSLAYLRSQEGDHALAVADFESLSPIVHVLSRVSPLIYCDYLNNFALVLSRAGLFEEARRSLRIALASSFAPRFPEWRETENEIEEAAQKEPRRRSATATVVAIPTPRGSPRKAPIRAPQNSPTVFLLVIARRPQVTGLTSRERNIVSPLLERYVKTVRIRDQP